jgi:hypothetical protein
MVEDKDSYPAESEVYYILIDLCIWFWIFPMMLKKVENVCIEKCIFTVSNQRYCSTYSGVWCRSSEPSCSVLLVWSQITVKWMVSLSDELETSSMMKCHNKVHYYTISILHAAVSTKSYAALHCASFPRALHAEYFTSADIKWCEYNFDFWLCVHS